MEFSLGAIFAIIAMFAYGSGNAIIKPAIKKIGPPLSIFYRNLTITAIFLFLILFLSPPIENLAALVPALAIAAFGYLPFLLYAKSIKDEKVGVITSITSTSAVVTLILASIFYNEILSTPQIGAIFAIIAGIFLLTSHNGKIFSGILSPKAMLLAFGASFFWGIFYFLTKIPISQFGPLMWAFILEATVLLAAFAHTKLSSQKIFIPKKNTLLHLMGAGTLAAIGTLSISTGISLAPVSIVTAIAVARPLVSSLLAKFALDESLSPAQWLGIMLTIGSISALMLLS